MPEYRWFFFLSARSHPSASTWHKPVGFLSAHAFSASVKKIFLRPCVIAARTQCAPCCVCITHSHTHVVTASPARDAQIKLVLVLDLLICLERSCCCCTVAYKATCLMVLDHFYSKVIMRFNRGFLSVLLDLCIYMKWHIPCRRVCRSSEWFNQTSGANSGICTSLLLLMRSGGLILPESTRGQ